MIPVKKLTPLSFGYRVTSRQPPQPEMVVIVRGKFHLRPGEPLELVKNRLDRFTDESVLVDEAKQQLEEAAYMLGQGVLDYDTFEADDADHSGQLLYANDFEEFKPKADVMLRGFCHPPRGSSVTECTVGFGVGDFYKELKVYGPRVWVDKIMGGKHTDPLAFKKLPIDYCHAFGGPENADNPVGMGQARKELPYLEDPKWPITRAGATPKPVGFGPISREWPLRKNKLGTEYGETWEKTREPWYAVDYDWTQQNAAPADQQLDHYLRGDEPLRFVNLHPEVADFTTALPGLRPRVFAALDDDGAFPRGEPMSDAARLSEVSVVLDTVYADLEEEVLYVTWRGHTNIVTDDMAEVKYLLVAHEQLADPALPSAHYLEQLQSFADDPFGLKDNPASELAKLEDKLESGELDRELDALGEDEDPVSHLLAPMAEKLPDGDGLMQQIADGMKKTAGRSAEAGKALKDSVKQALRAAFDGGGGPRLIITPKGEVKSKPLVRHMMREMKANQPPGTDAADANELVVEELKKLELEGIDPADLEMPENLEPPEPVPGADFTGCDLSGKDYAGADLRGCNFEGAILRETSLRGCDLTGSSFLGASLARVDLSDANCADTDFTVAQVAASNLRNTDLSGATLDQTNFNKCDLNGAKFAGANASMAQLMKCQLSNLNARRGTFFKCIFNECEAQGARFDNAKLTRSFFRKTDLSAARFDRADISNAGFFECDLTKTVFYAAVGGASSFLHTTLRETDFSFAELPASFFLMSAANGSNFAAADLPSARFYRAVLRDACFDEANLIHADINKASLTDASFRKSNCYSATFIEAHGTDADFRGANVTLANFKRSQLVKKGG